jgi:hypothetical protein
MKTALLLSEQPVRVQRKRTKGWRKPDNTVNVTRPGKWGNPFDLKAEENKLYMERKPRGLFRSIKEIAEVEAQARVNAVDHFKSSRTAADKALIKQELKGKNLMCWCKEGEYCHGDILLQIANS